jgi:hypothetical protein
MRAENRNSVSHARDGFVTDATAANRRRNRKIPHGTPTLANNLSNQPLAAVLSLGNNPAEAPPKSGTAIAHFLT